MRIGQAVEVYLLAFPGCVFKAKISWGAHRSIRAHRLSVRADVENPDGALKPGMFANFSIITGDPETAPAVPQSAIVYEGDTATSGWLVTMARSPRARSAPARSRMAWSRYLPGSPPVRRS